MLVALTKRPVNAVAVGLVGLFVILGNPFGDLVPDFDIGTIDSDVKANCPRMDFPNGEDRFNDGINQLSTVNPIGLTFYAHSVGWTTV
jgi:hypothetical protein